MFICFNPLYLLSMCNVGRFDNKLLTEKYSFLLKGSKANRALCEYIGTKIIVVKKEQKSCVALRWGERCRYVAFSVWLAAIIRLPNNDHLYQQKSYWRLWSSLIYYYHFSCDRNFSFFQRGKRTSSWGSRAIVDFTHNSPSHVSILYIELH